MASPEYLVCLECGGRNLPGEQFCGNCGAYLAWESSSSETAGADVQEDATTPAPANGAVEDAATTRTASVTPATPVTPVTPCARTDVAPLVTGWRVESGDQRGKPAPADRSRRCPAPAAPTGRAGLCPAQGCDPAGSAALPGADRCRARGKAGHAQPGRPGWPDGPRPAGHRLADRKR